MQSFQNDPDCKVFLISLKAGGLGLNLTAADYIFLLDPWWNPAVESQAIDRAHRIGQTRPVFAYRLIAEIRSRKRCSSSGPKTGPGRRDYHRRQQPHQRPRPRRSGVAPLVNSTPRYRLSTLRVPKVEAIGHSDLLEALVIRNLGPPAPGRKVAA